MECDYGNLICKCTHTEFLPRLFLQEDCYKKLLDFIVLDSQWLMTVMKVIMELTVKNDIADLSPTQVQKLETEGVADFDVFKACWDKFLPTPCAIEIRDLVLIFQAYCLVYPIHSMPKYSTCSQPELTGSQPEVCKYIIPCKLPGVICRRDVHRRSKKFSAFYIDFLQFLPNEIYHCLICLASSHCKVRVNAERNGYSKKGCFFVNLHETNWLIKMEQEQQQLKIMFK